MDTLNTAESRSQPSHAGKRSALETDPPLITPQVEDQELLRQVAAQDQQAFDTLYACYAPRVRVYLARRLSLPDLVDEVLQDVMLTLWQQAARVPPTTPLIAWLCGVARHKAYKALARASDPLISQEPNESINHDAPDTVLLRQEQLRALTRELGTLPRSERTALELLVFKGLSPQEIAVAMGDPVSTVRTRIWRARRRLQARVSALASAPC